MKVAKGLNSMTAPTRRSEFEHNINLLEEKSLEQEQIQYRGRKYMKANFITPGLGKLKKLPNGRVDFYTVDESLRLSANSHNHFGNEQFVTALTEMESTRQTRANDEK